MVARGKGYFMSVHVHEMMFDFCWESPWFSWCQEKDIPWELKTNPGPPKGCSPFWNCKGWFTTTEGLGETDVKHLKTPPCWGHGSEWELPKLPKTAIADMEYSLTFDISWHELVKMMPPTLVREPSETQYNPVARDERINFCPLNPRN